VKDSATAASHKHNAHEGSTQNSSSLCESASTHSSLHMIVEECSISSHDSRGKGKRRATESEVLMMDMGDRIDRIMDAFSRQIISEHDAEIIHYCLRDIELVLDI